MGYLTNWASLEGRPRVGGGHPEAVFRGALAPFDLFFSGPGRNLGREPGFWDSGFPSFLGYIGRDWVPFRELPCRFYLVYAGIWPVTG